MGASQETGSPLYSLNNRTDWCWAAIFLNAAESSSGGIFAIVFFLAE
jgi:hypothetical protein